MPTNVQVAEDSEGKLVHLLAEVHYGKSLNPIAFVQTTSGVESTTTGLQSMSGKLRHRFTATYPGTKEQYIQSVHSAGYDGQHKKQMLKKAGAMNIRKGFGAAMKVASIGAAGITGYQVAHLWTTYNADGIITPEEGLRMGMELAQGSNPVAAFKDIWQATHDGIPGMDLGRVAEQPTGLERVAADQGVIGDVGASSAVSSASVPTYAPVADSSTYAPMADSSTYAPVADSSAYSSDIADLGEATAGEATGGFLSEVADLFFG